MKVFKDLFIKTVVLVFIILISNNLNAQSSIYGEVQYKCIVNYERDSLNYSSSNNTIWNSLLAFTPEESLCKDSFSDCKFKDNEASLSLRIGDEYPLLYYRDQQRKQLISREYLTRLYIVNEVFPNFDWKLNNNTKKIGRFNCVDATTTFRGRKYIAWFAPSIPVPYGPWKFGGLPGLILSVSDTDKQVQFLFQSLKVNIGKNVEIKEPNKGEAISYEEFKELRKKKMTNMITFLASRVGNIDSSPKIYSIEKYE